MVEFFSHPRRRWLLSFVLAGWLIIFALPMVALNLTPNQQLEKRAEIRGVWLTNIDSDVFFQRQRLRGAIDRLQQLNFNTLYPAVWNWGYTLYPSPVAQKYVGKAVMPQDSIERLLNRPLPQGEGLQRRDLLQEIIERGHRDRLAVIPWFEFGLMTTAASDPAGSDLAKQHPNWLAHKRDGSTITKEGVHERVWLNPLHPEVQQFVKELLVEVVRNYKVDGIQLDDHFGNPYEYGYDPLTVKLYQAEHQGKAPPNDPQDLEWTNWRAQKITILLKDLFQAIKQANPRAIVSISPNPQEFSKQYFLADWVAWERAGLVEELILQVYRNDLARFTGELQKPEVQRAKSHIPVGIGILSGLKPRRIPLTQIKEQVQAMRKQGLAGASFFFYETLWNLRPVAEGLRDRQAGLRQLFPQAVPRKSVKF